MSKPSQNVTTGQLSLAIPLWTNTTSTSWDVNRRNMWCTGPVSVISV